MSEKPMEAHKYVWEGAIPLQIHLHDSEVTTLPPPPPTLILAPRIGYLPLLAPLIEPHFSSSLPPGVDTIWFEYKGLPLKWYIPTGVLFDLLCAEPERPWNLTVHFRGYPADVLTPCDGEDSVKWSFINSLKEAACIITGNCKNIMNMSQSDQVDLWRSVMDVDLDAYARISSKLKLGALEDDYTSSCITKSQQSTSETGSSGQVKTGRIPVRFYVRNVTEDFDDFEDLYPVESWDKISYINQPVEIHREGKYFSMLDALKMLLPDCFLEKAPLVHRSPERVEAEEGQAEVEETAYGHADVSPKIKLVRIQGIEPKLDIPFSWVVNNLMNPEHFLHICVCIKLRGGNAT